MQSMKEERICFIQIYLQSMVKVALWLVLAWLLLEQAHQFQGVHSIKYQMCTAKIKTLALPFLSFWGDCIYIYKKNTSIMYIHIQVNLSNYLVKMCICNASCNLLYDEVCRLVLHRPTDVHVIKVLNINVTLLSSYCLQNLLLLSL